MGRLADRPLESSLGIGVVEMRRAASASTMAGCARDIRRRRSTIQMNALVSAIPARGVAELAADA